MCRLFHVNALLLAASLGLRAQSMSLTDLIVDFGLDQDTPDTLHAWNAFEDYDISWSDASKDFDPEFGLYFLSGEANLEIAGIRYENVSIYLMGPEEGINEVQIGRGNDARDSRIDMEAIFNQLNISYTYLKCSGNTDLYGYQAWEIQQASRQRGFVSYEYACGPLGCSAVFAIALQDRWIKEQACR